MLEIGELTTLADYFCAMYRLVQHTDQRLGGQRGKGTTEQAGEEPLHREGYRGGTWVLLDWLHRRACVQRRGPGVFTAWSACGGTARAWTWPASSPMEIDFRPIGAFVRAHETAADRTATVAVLRPGDAHLSLRLHHRAQEQQAADEKIHLTIGENSPVAPGWLHTGDSG